ncbi:5'-methylthioadenosine/S-adenosylhomocysteine nucleosidase [Sporosarcina sp. UB5]|uniref:5'-methylthioadenosine/S-adenosylhomocysteine nucleosidase n=1 Tax=Sporosarcina sp. UB5 TaxID=3047463 RepID=UPI003D7AF6DF
MKIAIIGAMEQEVEILRGKIEDSSIDTVAGCEFIKGKIAQHDIVLVKSGIGKVNAAIATTLLIQRFTPDVVLNTGSAGGFKQSLEVGTVVISDEVRHHDVDATAFGYEIGQVPGMPATYRADETLIRIAKEAVEEIGEHHYAVGLIASGDVFMSDAERVNVVKEQFPSMIAAEMEAAAVAQVCHQFETPFVVIRALSDIAGKESSVSFEEFLPLAAQHSSEIVMHAISKL